MAKCYYDKQSMLTEYRCSFVTAKDHADKTRSKNSPGAQLNSGLTGTEVKEFYEEIINEPSLSTSRKVKTNKKRKRTTRMNVKQELDTLNENRWVTMLLKYSSSGSLKEVQELLDNVKERRNYTKLINSRDSYGWTALMCAAAEGHLSVVKYLIKKGCEHRNVCDTSEMNVLDICQKRQQWNILNYLYGLDVKTEKNDPGESRCIDTMLRCELCKVEYLESKQKQHESSMLHIFNHKNKKPSNILGLPGHNVGYKMMLRSGWTIDRGLGPDGTGRKNPIKTVLKKDRAGLGLKKKSERVSHFAAHDEAAVSGSGNLQNRLQKKCTMKTYERKRKREKDWEQNMRRYMSSNYE